MYLILDAIVSLEMLDAIASLALISCGQTFLGSLFLRIILITMDDDGFFVGVKSENVKIHC